MPPAKRLADDGRELVEPKDAAAWRRWLERNAETSDAIWLVFRKKPTGSQLTYVQAVEEALCFGWIDSTVKALDDERNRQLFSLRKPSSTWASSNKERVKRLREEGRMTPAGERVIEIAKGNGMWSALDSVERLEIPDDLAAAFKRNKKAATNYESFSPSSKKLILWWIKSAKRDETRTTRIKETVRLAAKGIRANHPEAKGQ